MPFLLIRNDITKIQADAIVNTASTELREGSGTSRAIYLAAGEEKLQKACRKIGHCDPGKAVITRGFGLPAKYIIHAVGPVWRKGASGEEEILYSAYMESMKLAKKHRLSSIAFPLISSGYYGYPKEQALKTAVSAISDFLMEHEMLVYLVIYDDTSFAVSRKLFASIEEYIDGHYVEEHEEEECFRGRRGSPECPRGTLSETVRGVFPEHTSAESDGEAAEKCPELLRGTPPVPACGAAPPDPAPKGKTGSTVFRKKSGYAELPVSESNQEMFVCAAPLADAVEEAAAVSAEENARQLDDLMKHLGESFSQMLLRLIDERGLTDPEVYHRANIDRKLFSKIRNNRSYSPRKKTVLAFAVALELSLDETVDLLRTAGYSLSDSSRFDVILNFFLEKKIYDIFEINEMLFYYGQPLLGG